MFVTEPRLTLRCTAPGSWQQVLRVSDKVGGENTATAEVVARTGGQSQVQFIFPPEQLRVGRIDNLPYVLLCGGNW